MIKDLNDTQIRQLLGGHYIGSLGYIAQRAPYVLPITYFYDEKSNHIISYAMEGHKINAMREFPEVTLMVYEMDALKKWRSVMVHGIFEELHQIDAKYHLREFSEGIRKLLKQQGVADVDSIDDFSSKSETTGIPLVYRIRITEWSGKEREGLP
jgi:nitroimidazol reductase NimA-like FMN-containing flavoprotein (pyridoxamine 5'-phosphate oxidase superfamily)